MGSSPSWQLTEFHSFLRFNNATLWWLPRPLSGEESACQRLSLWVGKILWRRKWQSTLIFLLGNSHGQRSLAGYSPLKWFSDSTTAQHRMYILSPFSIRLLTRTSLCCVHIMATGSSAAMNTRVRVSFQISFFIFSGYIPGVELLYNMVVLF